MNRPDHHASNSVNEIPFIYRGLVFHDCLVRGSNGDEKSVISILASNNGRNLDRGGWQCVGHPLRRTVERDRWACDKALSYCNKELKKAGMEVLKYVRQA